MAGAPPAHCSLGPPGPQPQPVAGMLEPRPLARGTHSVSLRGRRKAGDAVNCLFEPLVSGGFSRLGGINKPLNEIPENSQDPA